MFFAVAKIENKFKRVQDAADKAAFRNIRRAAFQLFTVERDSIKQADGPSAPGTPPHTHTGGFTKKGKIKRGFLPRSFAYSADRSRKDAVIGPRASIVGESASAHELGGDYKGERYPERSFAKPALEKINPEFAGSFANSIGA